MTLLRLTACALASAVLALGPVDALAHPTAGRWTWPLDPVPRVVRYFEPPAGPYAPGHRGVDLAGVVGEPVLAIGAGTVTFAGSVAGRGVVVVDHGALRSTYQPVASVVPVGTRVGEGQRIGLLELVHSHCLPEPCLHLGVRQGATYLDPLTLLGPVAVRLKPLDGLPTPPGGAVGQRGRTFPSWDLPFDGTVEGLGLLRMVPCPFPFRHVGVPGGMPP